jgi:hypothetical protein
LYEITINNKLTTRTPQWHAIPADPYQLVINLLLFLVFSLPRNELLAIISEHTSLALAVRWLDKETLIISIEAKVKTD